MGNHEDVFMKRNAGKFAIKHAGLVVIPEKNGKRQPFKDVHEATIWAKKNYRGDDWKVTELGGSQ